MRALWIRFHLITKSNLYFFFFGFPILEGHESKVSSFISDEIRVSQALWTVARKWDILSWIVSLKWFPSDCIQTCMFKTLDILHRSHFQSQIKSNKEDKLTKGWMLSKRAQPYKNLEEKKKFAKCRLTNYLIKW